MASHIQLVRDAIDQIDGAPFGKVGALLDAMAVNADKAIATQDALLKALEGMVLVCGRTGDAFYDFEEQAEAFHRETGWMRPGKDMPMESSGVDNTAERRIKYNAWVQIKIEAGRAALATAEPTGVGAGDGEKDRG